MRRGARPSSCRRASAATAAFPISRPPQASVFSGSRTTSSVSGTTPQRVFRWRKVSTISSAYSSGFRAWERSPDGSPAEIDVAEIDEEPLASRRQPSLQRQQIVLDLVVDMRELEAGGIRDVRIGVVVDLLVHMCPHFLVGDLALHEAGPVIDRVLRAAIGLRA